MNISCGYTVKFFKDSLLILLAYANSIIADGYFKKLFHVAG